MASPNTTEPILGKKGRVKTWKLLTHCTGLYTLSENLFFWQTLEFARNWMQMHKIGCFDLGQNIDSSMQKGNCPFDRFGLLAIINNIVWTGNFITLQLLDAIASRVPFPQKSLWADQHPKNFVHVKQFRTHKFRIQKIYQHLQPLPPFHLFSQMSFNICPIANINVDPAWMKRRIRVQKSRLKMVTYNIKHSQRNLAQKQLWILVEIQIHLFAFKEQRLICRNQTIWYKRDQV